MSGWDELLRRLAEVPRENGTAALHETAGFLYEALAARGVTAELVAFTAHPYALRLAGVLALGGGLFYLRMMRSGRHAAALAAALAVPALLVAELDFQKPVFGWIGAETQRHVVARIPVEDPQQRLIFSAHYDSKTDVLDHVERAPVDILAGPIVPLMIVGAVAAAAAGRVRRGRRLLRGLGAFAGWAGAAYGVLAFVALSAGVFVPARSPGALDDGAACAVLVRLAETLAAGPALARTDVEVALLSAEEVGVQGSSAYVARRFGEPPDVPTFVVNLEGIGASKRHGVLPSERFTLRSYAPDPELVGLLDDVHRDRFGERLERLPVGGATDARSFLARGIPAATVVTRRPGELLPRGLHSARDDRSRVDEQALDATLAYLLEVARALDRRGLERVPVAISPRP